MQGKSSKAFKDALGYVGSEEIIHRNNICLLSIVQTLDSDMSQDGAPSLSADDEPSPMKMPLSGMYGSMPNQAGIPGLSNPAWPQQQQQNLHSGYYQDGHQSGSLPMQNLEGNFPGPTGGSITGGQYWQQPQHGSNRIQIQDQGHMGAGAFQDSQGGNYPPSFPPGTQQGWHDNSGGNPPGGVVKQEPAAQPASYIFPPQRNPNAGPASSGLDPSPSYPTLPYSGSFPPQVSHNTPYNSVQPTSRLAAPGGKLPPHNTSLGMSGPDSSQSYQPHQQGFSSSSSSAQAAFVPSSQGHAPPQSHRDSRGPPPGMSYPPNCPRQ